MRNDSNSNNLIAFDKVSKIFESKDVALSNASFSVSKGEFLCIIGPSGGGKSTALKLIAGLLEPSSGNIVKPRNISMVFQSGALLPWLTVAENIALGLRRAAHENTMEKVIAEYVAMVELNGLERRYPREISGGQRQRVGIARALAVNPEVLLLDEPFSSLDAKTTEELHEDLLRIWKETGKTIVMVSHLIEEAVSLADRIVLMKNHTVTQIFPIEIPRPRRNNAEQFSREVLKIRKEFFA